MALSEDTKSGEPRTGAWSSTRKDMEDLMEWEYGDPEPEGSHALGFEPHTRLRRDLAKGAKASRNYDHNVIYVDTFKPVDKQLKEIERAKK